MAFEVLAHSASPAQIAASDSPGKVRRMNPVEITAFEARVMRLAADGKIPAEVVAGISRLIAKVNELQMELNRLKTK